jgi:hypothetical protein
VVQFSCYLAVKTGPHPKFTKLTQVSCDSRTPQGMQQLQKYLKDQNCVFRAAIDDIANHVGGHCGLALQLQADGSPSDGSSAETSPFGTKVSKGMHRAGSMEGASSAEHSPERGHKSFSSLAGMGPPSGSRASFDDSMNGLRHDGDSSGSEDDEDDETKHNRLQALEFQLAQRLEDLRAERTSQLNINSELQKKCVTLILKEKSLQVQNSNNPSSKSGTPSSSMFSDAPNNEMSAEKEKQYMELLNRITEYRKKLKMQYEEFDLLAHDLQVRLDDKEFKSADIGASFKQFKKYDDCFVGSVELR